MKIFLLTLLYFAIGAVSGEKYILSYRHASPEHHKRLAPSQLVKHGRVYDIVDNIAFAHLEDDEVKDLKLVKNLQVEKVVMVYPVAPRKSTTTILSTTLKITTTTTLLTTTTTTIPSTTTTFTSTIPPTTTTVPLTTTTVPPTTTTTVPLTTTTVPLTTTPSTTTTVPLTTTPSTTTTFTTTLSTSTVPGMTYYYEPLQTMVTQHPPSWGQDRIDGIMDGNFTFPSSSGNQVRVYVIDGEINVNHDEFRGHAFLDVDFTSDTTSCNGSDHGTHVASIVGGFYVGMTQRVTIQGVKIFPCSGGGVGMDTVLKSIQYVIDKHNNSANKKTIINMSMEGGYTQATSDMIKKAWDFGILTVVAAGNNNIDACTVSPGGSPEAITVAALDRHDVHASFSNWGPCVDIYAPGVDIFGAVKNGYNALSGTSMSSPHVAGIAASWLSTGDFSVQSLSDKISYSAKTVNITGIPANTINKVVNIL